MPRGARAPRGFRRADDWVSAWMNAGTRGVHGTGTAGKSPASHTTASLVNRVMYRRGASTPTRPPDGARRLREVRVSRARRHFTSLVACIGEAAGPYAAASRTRESVEEPAASSEAT